MKPECVHKYLISLPYTGKFARRSAADWLVG